MTSLLQRGCVKSVQRGYRDILDGRPNQPLTINISPIDPNKSILLIDADPPRVHCDLLQSSIVVHDAYGTEVHLSYQVVEFY